MNSLEGGFGATASDLTFQDPDDEDEVGVDTQADDFRFNFTIPSQNFGAAGNFGGLASQNDQVIFSKLFLINDFIKSTCSFRYTFKQQKCCLTVKI